MENILLRCATCNELFCPTSYDKHPSYKYNNSDGSFREIENNDLDSFNMEHKNHVINELKIIKDSFCSNYAYWKVIREDYLKAEDDFKTYTIKRWRNAIDEPLKYEIINCDIIYGKPKLEIQFLDIKRQMIADSRIYKFDAPAIDIIISLYDNFISQISVDDVIECGFSMDDPMVSYAKLSNEFNNDFLRYCEDVLSLRQIDTLKQFIDDNSEYDDVMNVRIIRSFWLKPTNNRKHITKFHFDSVHCI